MLLCACFQVSAAEEQAAGEEAVTEPETSVVVDAPALTEQVADNDAAPNDGSGPELEPVQAKIAEDTSIPSNPEEPSEDDSAKTQIGPKANNIEKGRLRERKNTSDENVDNADDLSSDAAMDANSAEKVELRDDAPRAIPSTVEQDALVSQKSYDIHLLDFGATWLVYGSDLRTIQIADALLDIPALSMQARVQVIANDGRFLILSGKQLSLFKSQKQALKTLVLQQAVLPTTDKP